MPPEILGKSWSIILSWKFAHSHSHYVSKSITSTRLDKALILFLEN